MKKNLTFNAIQVLFQDTMFYAVVNALSRSAHLLIFPILSRSMAIGEFGIHELIYSAMNILITFVILGIESAVFRFYFEDIKNANKAVSSSLFFIMISSVFTLLILLLLMEFINPFENQNSFFNRAVFFALLSLPFAAIFGFSEAICRLKSKKIEYLILNVGYASLLAASVLTLKIFASIKLDWLFISYTIIWIIMGCIGVFFIRENLSFSLSLPPKNFFQYGIPICLTSVVMSSSPFVERTVILAHLDTEALGLYSAIAKIAMVYLLPINAFQIAFVPFAMRHYKAKYFKDVLQKVLIASTLLLSLGLIWITPFTVEVVGLLASEKYAQISHYLLPLLFVMILQSGSGILSIGLLLGSKTHLKLFITSIGTLLFIFCLDAFIPIHGLSAIIYTLLSVKICTHLFEFFAAQSTFYINWDKKVLIRLVLYLIVVFSICNASFFVNSNNIIISALLTFFTLVYFVVGNFKTSIFDVIKEIKSENNL